MEQSESSEIQTNVFILFIFNSVVIKFASLAQILLFYSVFPVNHPRAKCIQIRTGVGASSI